jgi:hypothetical protein
MIEKRMQILYLIKKKPDETLEKLIAEQRKSHEVEIIPLGESPDYGALLEKMAAADQVISW